MKMILNLKLLQTSVFLLTMLLLVSCYVQPASDEVTNSQNTYSTVAPTESVIVPVEQPQPVSSEGIAQEGDLSYNVSTKGILPTDNNTPKPTFLGQVTEGGQDAIRSTPANMIRIIVRDRNDDQGRTDSVYELDISDSFTLEAQGALLFHKYPGQNMYLIDITGSEISNLVCHPGSVPIVLAQETPPVTPTSNNAAAAGAGLSIAAIIACILCCL